MLQLMVKLIHSGLDKVVGCIILLHVAPLSLVWKILLEIVAPGRPAISMAFSSLLAASPAHNS